MTNQIIDWRMANQPVNQEQLIRDLLAQLEIASKALEQHHKDLMGLVEAWREEWNIDVTAIDGKTHADQLESLINPKD